MSCNYCWPGNCCGGPNCIEAEMKEKPIKPRIVWMAAHPDGTLVVHVYASSQRAIQRGLADTAKQWRKLETEGWRAIRVRIAPVNADR